MIRITQLIVICLVGNALLAFHPEGEIRCSHHRSEFFKQQSADASIDVLDYSLKFDFTEMDEELHGTAVITFKALTPIESLELDLLALTVDRVNYHGKKMQFAHNEETLTIGLNSSIAQNKIDSIEVVYHGKPKIDDSDFGGFYFRQDYMFNMGVAFVDEPHVYGRSWFPCVDNFTDRATYNYEIISPKGYRAYCNGLRTSEVSPDEKTTVTRWAMSTEIPTYLAAIYVGKYKNHHRTYHSTIQNKDIPIMIVSRPEEMPLAKGSFKNLDSLMGWFEKMYGPYYWEKIGFALVPFESGAMEHATLIAYPMEHADGTLEREDLMAHELSHHWWGNWVTCADPKEMWINEGMASYSECLFYEGLYGKEAYLKEMRNNHYSVLQRAHYYDQGHYALNEIPGAHTYGVHSYKKGADVVHTLRTYMGDEAFFKGLQYIQKMYGGKNISTEEFDACMYKYNGAASSFFKDWVYQAGGMDPSIEKVESKPKGENFELSITISQTLRAASHFYHDCPVTVKCIDENFEEYDAEIKIDGSSSTVTFTSPIDPLFVGLNLDEKISFATTARHQLLTSPSKLDWRYANCMLDVSAVQDTSFLMVEHHWVPPSGKSSDSKIYLSPERYWLVDGLGVDELEGTMELFYNSQFSATGLLDSKLFATYPKISTKGLVLCYRADKTADWEIHNDYELLSDEASKGLKGWIKVNSILKGEYCIAYKAG